MDKKLLATVLLVVALAFGLCACGQSAASSSSAAGSAASSESASSQAVSISEFKTMSDVFSVGSTSTIAYYDESRYVYGFNVDDAWVRVVADLPKDVYIELADIDPIDVDAQAKTEELLGPLSLAQVDILAESTPTQEELDVYVGKTGKDLIADGFNPFMLMLSGDETDCFASKSPFAYVVAFKGAVEDADTEDIAGAVGDMVIESVTFNGLSDDVILI